MTLLAVVLVASILGGLGYDAPAEWTSKPSSSSMRVAQWELLGDDASAEVVIFYFGEGGGGGVDANLDRWLGQFEQPDGSSTREKATITERSVNGLELTIVDMRGTFVRSCEARGARAQPPSRTSYDRGGRRRWLGTVVHPRARPSRDGHEMGGERRGFSFIASPRDSVAITEKRRARALRTS